MTAEELKNIASRINRQGSYSGERFGLFAKQIKRDLNSGIDRDVTYSGPIPGVYEYTFSYEPQDQHDAETRAAANFCYAHPKRRKKTISKRVF
jgi:hypothetical protein